MNSDSENNPRATGETSTTAQQLPEAPVKLPPRTSEAEFLRQQAREAQAAMRQALADIGTDAAHAVDPRLWTKEYPWASLGAALVGGFAAAAAMVPNKRTTALRRLEKIEEVLAAGERRRQKEEQKQAAKEATKEALKEDKPSTSGQFVKQLLGILQPAIVSAIAAGVRGKMEQQQEHHGNGHDPRAAAQDMSGGGV